MSEATKERKAVTVGEIARIVGGELSGNEAMAITDVTHDSREAREGSLFAAVRGALTDAHEFIPKVIAHGAAGVISESKRPPGWDALADPQSGRGHAPAAWLQVENVRRAMALAAAEVHHHPSRELELVGITGTNGKTTTAYLIASIADAAGAPA